MEYANVSVRRLGEHPDAPGVFPTVVALIHEAGNPYFDWFFGDPERTAATLAAWVERPSSEVSASRVTLLLIGDALAGMMITLSGAELRHSRQADALALAKEAGRDAGARAGLLERIQASSELFAPAGADDFYLSKIGILPAQRGKGLGRTLALEFLAAGRAAGFRRFRLDVSADNEPAVLLYRSLGFAVVSQGEAPGIRYLSMLLADA